MSDDKKPLLSHFKELRQRLIIVVAVFSVALILALTFLCDPVLEFVEEPLLRRNIPIIYTGVSDAFLIRLKVSFILGIIISSPVIFFVIWRFIKPALYEREIKKFRLLFTVSLCLFIMGIIFCYRVVYSLALDFFIVAGEGIAEPLFAMDKYLNFLLSFLLPFGVAFELPVVIYMLASHGVVDHKQLSALRKYILLLIVTISAILTPPDVVSQIMLSVPLYLLYEIGVLVARLCKRQ
ncbi:MAG: twin-arginine translocase subunit TatC [Lachnospiraceae bacterium]|nr:twin-arginine translocase subunit TatC [Lachnospiraceae bacterium]